MMIKVGWKDIAFMLFIVLLVVSARVYSNAFSPPPDFDKGTCWDKPVPNCAVNPDTKLPYDVDCCPIPGVDELAEECPEKCKVEWLGSHKCFKKLNACKAGE